MQEQDQAYGAERITRERRVVNKSCDDVYAAVLFDVDGQTSVIRQPRFEEDSSSLGVGKRSTLIHSGQEYIVELLFIGDQREALNREKMYATSARASAIIKRRSESVGGATGGYLDLPYVEPVPEKELSTVEDSSDGETSSTEDVFPTKRRKKQPVQNPINIELLGSFEASTATPGTSAVRSYLDFLPDRRVTEKVTKFLTTGQVEVTANNAANERASCCEHCFLIPDLRGKMEQLLALHQQQWDKLETQGQTINQLNLKIDKLVGSHQANITFIDGIFDPDISTTDGGQTTNCVLPAGNTDLPLVPNPTNVSTVRSGGPTAVPTSVRVGLRKSLIDIGSHKCFVEFDETSCRIADSTIRKCLDLSDNIKTFCYTVTLATYTTEELIGHAVDGSRDGKLPLSPRRKEAIKQSAMDSYSVPHSQREEKWNKECREAINKKLRSIFSFSKQNEL